MVLWDIMKFELNKNIQVILVFVLAAATLTIAQSIITTGIVYIMGDFNVSSTIAQWTYSAFLLVVGIMIPLSAFISRRFTVKSVFIFSIGIFIIGSIICFLSSSIEVLIFGRILEAIGNGIILPYNQILLLKIIPEEKWQIYMGILGLVIGIAPVCGSFIGGFIIDYYTWRAIFLILSILAIIIFLVGFYFINVDLGREDYPLDYLSLILSILTCSGIMIGFTNTAEFGIMSLFVYIPIIIGIISLILFVKRQISLEKPLIKLNILKNKYFATGVVYVSILYFCLNGFTALVPIFVQGVANYSASISASIVFPGALIMILCNIIAPVLTNKFGIKKILILASIITTIGYGSMMFYTANSSILFMILTQMIRFIGVGFALMPATTWSLSMVSNQVEDGTAVNNTLRQISAAIGSSIIVVIATIFAGGNISHNLVSAIAFNKVSFIVVLLNIFLLLLAIFIIDDKEKIEVKSSI